MTGPYMHPLLARCSGLAMRKHRFVLRTLIYNPDHASERTLPMYCMRCGIKTVWHKR